MPIKPTSLGAVAALEQHIDTRWVLSYAAGLGLTDALYLDDAQPDGPFVALVDDSSRLGIHQPARGLRRRTRVHQQHQR